MENKEILLRLETVLEVSLRDLETTEECVNAALEQAYAMSTDGLLSERERHTVFKDIRELILDEETKAKKTIAISEMLLDSVLRVQKILTAR